MTGTQRVHKSVGALILAAGFSSRMKTPKPFLQYDAEKVFIEKIIDDYLEFGCKKIIITINEEHKEWNEIRSKFKGNDSIQFVVNRIPEYERFYSIKIGLENLDNMDYCFIQNVDNPFIERKILDMIYEERFKEGYTVPYFLGSGGHPVLLGTNVIKQIQLEKNTDQNFKEFLTGFQRKNVHVYTNRIHININTQEEYERYCKNMLTLS